MDELLVFETEHSRISQARDFRVAGYLIVEPKAKCTGLADLDSDQGLDLFGCLARAEALIEEILAPERIYILKFGEENPQVHFHVVPRTQTIERAYLADVPDGKPYSGARIVDWLWFHHESLGCTREESLEFVERARRVAEEMN